MPRQNQTPLDLTLVSTHRRGVICKDDTGKEFLVTDPEELHVGEVNLHIPPKIFEIVKGSPSKVRDIRTIR